MKSLRILLPVFAFGVASTMLNAQTLSSFTAGDLVVEEIGNGTTTLGGGAAPIFLDEYTTGGVLVGNVALPTTNGSGLSAVTDSGTGGTDGMISLSPNGEYISFSGYNAAVGTSGVTSTTATADQRVDGTVSYNGAITTNLLGTSAFNTVAVRGSFATGPTNVWANGKGNSTADGVWYSNGTSPALIANSNLRTIGYANGQLLAANATNILSVGSGLPTTGTITPASIIATSGTALEQFFFTTESGSSVSGPNTLYVADSGASATAILKYTLTSGTLTSGTWVADGSASISSFANTGAFGLTGILDGNGSVSIYGTTSNSTNNAGYLFGITDSSGYGGTLSGAASLLATAPADETFRGITLAPTIAVPEPSVTVLLASVGALTTAILHRRRKKTVSAIA